MASKKIVSVDREAAREVVMGAGRRAGKSVARKAAETRRAVGRGVQKRRDAALRQALKTCIGLSKKQTAVLEKLEQAL